jgi:cytoplasmic tRNA 2-thiolation protein 2
MSSCGEGSCGNHDEGETRPEKPIPMPKNTVLPNGPAIKSREGPKAIDKEKFIKDARRIFKLHLLVNTKESLIPPGSHVLVCLSGGPSSTAMLHLLQEIVSPHTYRTINFFYTALYVDVGAAVGLSDEERREKAEQVKNNFTSREHGSQKEFVCIPLEHLFKSDDSTDEQCVKKLQDYLQSFKTLSSKEDAFRQLIFATITNYAQKNGFQYVLTGESASNLAIRVISDVSKGRGYNLPLNVSFNDNRWQGLNILRPMKDKLAKEIAFYNAIHRLKTVFIPNMTTATPLKSSIDRLVEEFITTLQTDFPSTVHAILRTTEKLKTPLTTDQHNCILCGAILTDEETLQKTAALKSFITQVQEENNNNNILELERLTSLCCYGCKRELDFFQSEKHSSRLLSYEKIVDNKDESSISLIGSFKRMMLSDAAESLEENLIDDFPPYISDHITRSVKLSRESMKASISEFLLE